MTVAFAIGVCLGALFSAFVFSRVLLWVLKNWNAGTSRLLAAHGVSFLAIATIAVFVRGELSLSATALHFVAQLVWLTVDIWRKQTA